MVKLDVLTNVEALELTLSELDSHGRLKTVDAAQQQMVRSMAQALDNDATNAALWRQYREALKELMADDAGNSGDALDDLFPTVGEPPAA